MVKLDENLRIYTVPPPSSGILTPAIMKIMRGYNLEDESSMTNESLALFYHRLTETYKHMYSRRTLLGDELFVDVAEVITSAQVIFKFESNVFDLYFKVNGRSTRRRVFEQNTK